MSGQQQPQPVLIAPPRVTEHAFISVVWSGTAVATFALAFRYYVRIKSFRRLLPDDYIIGFAWTLLLATAITWQFIVSDLYTVMETSAGLRKLSPNFVDTLIRYCRGQLAVLILFYVGLWTVKANFLVFFYKLGNSITYYRIAFWCITVFTACSGLAVIGIVEYKCVAGSATYIMSYCNSEEAIRWQNISVKLNMALDVSTDALIMALPISVLWNVRITTRRRLALSGVFALVLITMIISIVRVTLSTVVSKDTSSKITNKQVESTWFFTWHFTESFVAVLVACLGSFKALFTTKERSQKAHEAAELHQSEQRKVKHQGYKRALMARAKHFQNSLFESVKETDGAMSKGVAKVQSSSERSLQRNESLVSTMPNLNKTNSYEMRDIPTLNSHGLINDDSRV